MKRLNTLVLVSTLLSGCVVAPVPAVYVPPGVRYVGPVYAAPGPGYVWKYDMGIGWGWWHPEYGWHRGR